MTLSDEEARRRRTQKTVLERKAPPTFQVLIEIQEKDRFAIHDNVAEVVDCFLRGLALNPEIRIRAEDGSVEIQKTLAPARAQTWAQPPGGTTKRRRGRNMRIFSYGVSRVRLEHAIDKFRAPAAITTEVERADILLTLKSQEKRAPRSIRDAEARGVPKYVLKSNTNTQIENFLNSVFSGMETHDTEQAALEEAEAAVRDVRENAKAAELAPRNAAMRRLQHILAEKYGLRSKSAGREPNRRVVIYPENRFVY